MAISDRFTTLRQRLGASRQVEDERLLQLYWNRAELKKELTRLQVERDKLLEQVQKQEGTTLKLREQFDQLEQHLGDPDVAVHALVYFQLRGLWRTCTAKVAKFSQQLQRQQEERERRRQLIEFDQARRRELAEFDRTIAQARATADALEAQLKMLETRLASLTGFWNYGRRRKLAEEVEVLRSKWDIAATKVTDLSDDRADLEDTPPPEFPGISIDGRRSVNTAVIAFAQQLTANLSSGGIAMLAKEGTSKRALDVRYGSREECGRLMLLLKEAAAIVNEHTADLAGLKQSTDGLRAAATYRSDADTVPLTDSIGMLPAPSTPVSGLESVNRAGINVLVDDYWEVYRALLQ
jgi:predicted  nucleic acid-binding Zn-ribbon protein